MTVRARGRLASLTQDLEALLRARGIGPYLFMVGTPPTDEYDSS
jgi:hypothetical protein